MICVGGKWTHLHARFVKKVVFFSDNPKKGLENIDTDEKWQSSSENAVAPTLFENYQKKYHLIFSP